MDLPAPERSRAVLIGVDDYRHRESLPSVRTGVRRLAGLLQDPRLWGLPAKHCVVLHNPHSSVNVLDAVNKAAKEAKDAFLVYFAGHGLVPRRDGELFLALRDSDDERRFLDLPYDDLRHEMTDTCQAAKRVVLLDCCFSGRALQGHMSPPDNPAALTDIEGTYVMTSASETSLSVAPEGEDFTAFTGELVKALSEGVPEAPDPLEMGALFDHVRRELKAKGRPEPQQRARNDGLRIALTRNRWTPAEPATATGDEQAVERRSGEAGKGDFWVKFGSIAAMFLVATVPLSCMYLRDTASSPLQYRSGDKPTERESSCNRFCGSVTFTWQLPGSGKVRTVFGLPSDDDKRNLSGTLRTKGSCDATMKWSVDSGSLHAVDGILTAGSSERKLDRYLATYDETLVFTAERTDTSDCSATVEWENADLDD
ncbi:caspase domain-containing protein [Streptomyces acidicola]|uniref:caspase domain-containing protein n=1 Tax=Streptomyces acidicola TaxID=2596892 RepID=UPI0037886817